MTRGSEDRNKTRFKKKIIAKHGLKPVPAGDPPGMRKLTDAELETLCRPFLEAEKNRIEESLRDDVCPDIVDLLKLVPEDHPARPAVESLASFFADFMPKPEHTTTAGGPWPTELDEAAAPPAPEAAP